MCHIHFTLKVNIENLENELPLYIILKIDIQDMEDFKPAELVKENDRIHSNVALSTPQAQKRQAQSDKDEE